MDNQLTFELPPVLPKPDLIFHEAWEIEIFKPSPCPVCKSPLDLYFINDQEKCLLCINEQCPYPFGFSDYHLYKINEEVERNRYRSSVSTISTSDWSEVIRNLDQPFSPQPVIPLEKLECEKLERARITKHDEDNIKNNLKNIKEMNSHLFSKQEDFIRNKQWLKKFADMQFRSGVPVLKEYELKQLGEVKCTEKLMADIDPINSQISVSYLMNEKKNINTKDTNTKDTNTKNTNTKKINTKNTSTRNTRNTRSKSKALYENEI